MTILIEDVAKYCVYVLLVVFCWVSLLSVLCAMRIFLISKSGWTITKLVHCLIPLCLLARVNDYAVSISRAHYEMIIMPIQVQDWVEMLSGSLPVYMFFTTYILVCLSWFYVFKKSLSSSPDLFKQIMKLYLAINAFVYTIYITFVMLMVYLPHYRFEAHLVETFYSATISVMTGAAFAFYGRQLYSRVHAGTAINGTKLMVANKVVYTAVICTAVFFLRAAMIVSNFLFLRKPLFMLLQTLLWSVFIELLPCMAILVLLGRTAVPRKSTMMDTETQRLVSYK